MKKENFQAAVSSAVLSLSCVFGYNSFVKDDAGGVPIKVIKEEKAAEGLSLALKNVKEEFEKIESKDDKFTIHKLFSGAATYLRSCQTMMQTSQFDPILGRVQSSYGWQRDKYDKFTDAVSAYLVSVGYDKPKELPTEKEKTDFSKIFMDLSEATKYE